MGREIRFDNADAKVTLGNRTALKSFLTKQIKKEGLTIEGLQYVFCSDQYLLQINNDFLSHDYYTDIISFDLSESKGNLIGEIYISVDRVKDNAQTHKTSIKEELLRVIFHGALHFCGYKDKKPADSKLMRQMEDKWITSFIRSLNK
jgi:rRNA maturation RNase YbeY